MRSHGNEHNLSVEKAITVLMGCAASYLDSAILQYCNTAILQYLCCIHRTEYEYYRALRHVSQIRDQGIRSVLHNPDVPE